MGRMSRAPLLLSVALALACGDDSAPETASIPKPPPTQTKTDGPARSPEAPVDAPPARPLPPTVDDSTTAGLMAAAGDAAPYVVVASDAAVKEATARIDAKLAAGAPRSLRRWLQAEDAPGLVHALFATLEHEVQAPEWTGRDAARPLVISMFEPPATGPQGASIVAMAPVTGRQMPLRHQVVIPATDSGALVASLKDWLDDATQEAPELVEGRAGAIGLRVSGKGRRTTWIALLPEDRHVRLVLLDLAIGYTDPGPVTRLLDARPSELPSTPALAHVTETPQGVGMLIRPWQLRSLAVWTGLYEAMRAVATVASEQQAMAMARGTSITAVAEWLMPDDNAEIDDWSLVARGDDTDLRLTTVASLTPLGRKVWGTQPKAAVPPLTVKPGAIAQGFVTGDPVGLIAAAPGFELDQEILEELPRSFQMCGIFCPSFALQRWPASMLATVTKLGGPMPSLGAGGGVGLQLALRSVDPPQFAAAIVGASPVTATALEGILATQSELATAKVREAKLGSDPVLLVELGIDADEVFDLSAKPGPADVIASGAFDPSLRPELPIDLAPLTVRVRITDVAWVGEAVYGPGKPSYEPDFSAASWSSPLVAAPSSKGTACLADATRQLFTGLDAAATVGPESLAEVLTKARSEADASLACAAADPATKRFAAGLKEVYAVMGAQALTEATFEVDAARELLTPACDAGNKHGVACIRRAQLGSVGTPTVPEGDVSTCAEQYGVGGTALIVDDHGVLLGGRETKPGASGLAEALVDRTSAYGRRDRKATGVVMVADPKLPWSKIVPILEGLSAVKVDPLLVVVDGKGRRVLVPMDLAWPGKVTVDWKFDPSALADDEEFLAEEPPPPAIGLGPATKPRATVTVSRKDMRVTEGGSIPRTLADPAAFAALLDVDPSHVVAVEVDDDVPWETIVELAVAACGHWNAWRLQPKAKPSK